MQNYAQSKGNYQNRNYSRNYNQSSTGSNSGSAKLISTKKDGLILAVELNNQNLILKGFWQSKGVGKDGGSGFKLYPYYDKTKINPQFNKPKVVQRDSMDDQMPNTDFDPNELEQQLNESGQQ